MKIFKLLCLFFVFVFLSGCLTNVKNNNTKLNFIPSSNFGLFLSTKYSLSVGDNDYASKILSNTNNLDKDLTLAELTFNNYLITGDFKKAKEFKTIAPSNLKKLSLYQLPDFIINIKNSNFTVNKNLDLIKNELPGFKIIFKKLSYLNFVKEKSLKNLNMNFKKSDIFDLLIFENTRIENKILKSINVNNQSIIEKFLYFGYLKRVKSKQFNYEIEQFSLKTNYDAEFLKSYFRNSNMYSTKQNQNFVLANLFSYLSLHLSSKKNVPNSYLKLLNEISNYLYPSLGISNYYLAELYFKEQNISSALKKLNKINDQSLVFLSSQIKKYTTFKRINKNKSDLLLKKIIQKYPENKQVILLIANDFKEKKMCKKANVYFDRLIRFNKNSDHYYYLKATCLEKLNKWEDAKIIFNNLITKNPNDAYVLNYLSYSMAIRDENLLKAKDLILKAINIEKNNGFFLDTLAWIEFKLNNVEKAIRIIQLAIQLEPNNSEIIDHLGDIYYKAGRKKEALNEWSRALKSVGSNALKDKIRLKLIKYQK